MVVPGIELFIENLRNSPDYTSRKHMRENEFFECSFCFELCEMPMSTYKAYRESEILKAKFRCARCYREMNNLNVTKEKVLALKEQGLKNTEIAKQLGVSEANYYYYLKKFGLTNPPKKNEVNKETKNHVPEVRNMVDRPPHYTSGNIECIDAIMDAVEGMTAQEAVCAGNIMKYVWRFKRKNGKQDLEKAAWYLNLLISMQKE